VVLIVLASVALEVVAERHRPVGAESDGDTEPVAVAP
jgi:hypothetical protein